MTSLSFPFVPKPSYLWAFFHAQLIVAFFFFSDLFNWFIYLALSLWPPASKAVMVMFLKSVFPDSVTYPCTFVCQIASSQRFKLG